MICPASRFQGQIVVENGLREQLGIEPGWLAIQRVVDGHLEVRFMPPAHRHSMAGVLASHTQKRVPETDWANARDSARQQAALDKMQDGD